MKISKTLHVKNRVEWRKWLEKNYATETEIWLICYKKHTNKPRIPYDDAVEEALCFGWIDTTAKTIDDERYAQRFTPRRPKSNWSDLNKQRVRKLIANGSMTKAGLERIDESILSGEDNPGPERQKKELEVPQYLKKALMKNKKALENFNKLAPSHQKNYVRWITSAKKEETRDKRIKEAINLLEKNEKLGMK